MSALRGQRVILFFIGVIAGGLALKLLADPRTLAAEVGSMLVGGALVGGGIFLFLRGRRGRSAAEDFAGPFAPDVAVELTLRRQPHVTRIEGPHRGIFVVGNQGFTVRFIPPPGVALEPGMPQRVEVEFLKPELAAAQLPAGELQSIHANLFSNRRQIMRPQRGARLPDAGGDCSARPAPDRA